MITRTRALAAVTLLGLLGACSSQEPVEPPSEPEALDTTRAGALFAKADQLGAAAQFDSALFYFEKASVLYEEDEDWRGYVHAYNKMWEQAFRRGAFEEAMTYLHRASDVATERLDENHSERARIHHNFGVVASMQGDFDEALALWEQALALRLATLGEVHPDVAASYNNIGILYRANEDYDRALEFFEKTLAIQLVSLSEQHPQVAVTYNNLGVVYGARSRYDRSLEFFEKSLAVRLDLFGEVHPDVAASYTNIGQFYVVQGEHDQALAFFEKTVEIRRALFGEVHPELSLSYSNIGNTYLAKGVYDQALVFFDKALSIRRTIFGEQHAEVAESYNEIGSAYAGLGDYDEALAYFQRALGVNVPAFSDTDPYANPPLETALNEVILLQTLARKAEVLATRYTEASHDLQDLEQSVATYRLVSQLTDILRNSYKAEGSKLSLAKEATAIFEKAISTTLRLYAATARDEYKATAFLFAEKSKANILLAALVESQAKQFAGIAPALLDQERQLRINLAFYERGLVEEQMKGSNIDSARVLRWQSQAFDLKRDYEALILQFEEQYPEYYNLKYQVETASVDEVQRLLLDEETALVEYFSGHDSLYLFAITRNDFDVRVVAKDARFEEQVRQLRAGVIEQDYARYTAAAYPLYQTLLAPVRDKLQARRLIIVPDDLISYVPFEALLTRDVEAPAPEAVRDYRSLPYLIDDYAVSYAYSSTLLMQTTSRSRSAPRRDYLAFAPVFSEGLPGGTRGLDLYEANRAFDSTRTAEQATGALPASRDEVDRILNLFTDTYGFFEQLTSRKARVYLEDEANEARVKASEVGQYRYVHFATHGFVNEAEPDLSGILLAPDTTSAEDGILHLGEVYTLDLNADLVVLSACETGLGQLVQGEGIIGLTRGFLYAGAGNIMVSLWKADDAATADLMVAFYNQMLTQTAKAEALQTAKRGLIRQSPRYARPYYWSSFILVGR